MKGKIRLATLADTEALLKIYAPFILDTCISFEYEVPTLVEYRERIAGISSLYPYLLYEENGKILGYTYAHRYLERAAYGWDVEVTIYLAPEGQGRGLGALLYSALEQLLRLQQVRNLYACITGDNAHSINMHRALGYKMIGTFTRAGFKQNRWLDVVWLEKSLTEDEGAPLKLVPFRELPQQSVAAVLQRVNNL